VHKISLHVDGPLLMAIGSNIVDKNRFRVLFANKDLVDIGKAFVVHLFIIKFDLRHFLFNFLVYNAHRLLIFVQLRNLVGSVRIFAAVTSDLVHLIVFETPVAVALLAVKFDDLLHDFYHQFTWLMHFVNFQADRAFVITSLVSCITCEELEAGFAGAGFALRTLHDCVKLWNQLANWTFKVVGLDH